MDAYSACISVYTIMPGANRGQKKTLTLLVLWATMWMLGVEPCVWGCCLASRMGFKRSISPSPCIFSFKVHFEFKFPVPLPPHTHTHTPLSFKCILIVIFRWLKIRFKGQKWLRAWCGSQKCWFISLRWGRRRKVKVESQSASKRTQWVPLLVPCPLQNTLGAGDICWRLSSICPWKDTWVLAGHRWTSGKEALGWMLLCWRSLV